MKKLFVVVLLTTSLSCATLTNDPMTPVAFSFSDGSSGKCELTNKRGVWSAEIPATVSIRRSDDALKYRCSTEDGRDAVGQIESTVGAKIVASAVFLDFGITDAITDKHREYAASFAIPVARKEGMDAGRSDSSASPDSDDPSEKRRDVYSDIDRLHDLRARGVITDAEFDAEKKKLLDSN